MDITYTQRRTHVGEWWVTWHRVRHCIHEECIDWFDKTMTEKILRKWTSGLFFWHCELLLTIEYSYHMRMTKSQEVELVHQSNYNQSFFMTIFSSFIPFLFQKTMPPSPFLFFFLLNIVYCFLPVNYFAFLNQVASSFLGCKLFICYYFWFGLAWMFRSIRPPAMVVYR